MVYVHGNRGNQNSSKGNYSQTHPKMYNKLYQYAYRNDIELNPSDACRVLLENYTKEELNGASGKMLLACSVYYTHSPI